MVVQAVGEGLAASGGRVRWLGIKESYMRDALVFFGGAEAFHTLSHLWLAASGMLPIEIQFPSMTITPSVNLLAIAVNGLVAAALLYGAKRLTR